MRIAPRAPLLARRLLDRPRGRDGVELVRVVEHRRLGRRAPRGVVMARRRRAAARRGPRLERRGPLLDQPQAEVDVAEQPALVGLRGTPGRAELACGRRRGAAPPRAAGRRAAAGAAARSRGRASRRRPCARAARRRSAWCVSAAGSPRSARAAPRPRRTAPRPRAGPDARSRAARNSRKPSSSSTSRRIAGASSAGSASSAASSDRTSSCSRSRNRSTRPSTRTASPSPKRAVQQLDVVPDPRLDPPARVDELQREVRRAALRPQPPLAATA